MFRDMQPSPTFTSIRSDAAVCTRKRVFEPSIAVTWWKVKRGCHR
jgi:hypothetical protein